MQRTPACPLITEEQTATLFHCRCLDDGGSLGTTTKGSLSCCIPISSQRDGAATPRAGAAVTARTNCRRHFYCRRRDHGRDERTTDDVVALAPLSN